jgi:hypothetical protein
MARWQRPASTLQVAAAAKDLQVTAAAVKEDLLSTRREKKTAKGGHVDVTREKKTAKGLQAKASMLNGKKRDGPKASRPTRRTICWREK